MRRWKSLLGLSLLGLGSAYGFYSYQNDNSFRSVCNLAYAGVNMACIYKLTSGTSE
jgi:hypothetical protein